jgi:site-specific DNA recombinase
MDNLNIAIYSRKSRYIENSDSVENQVQMCKEYIHKNYKKVNDIFVYEDEGFSGGNIDRPNFSKMMKDAKNKMFNIILCYRLDRISRNIGDFAKIIEDLQDYNIEFISIREQFDTTSPMGRAMLYIAGVFAQLERETIAERVRDNMLELSKSGKWLGGNTPFGYKKIGIGKDCYLDIDNAQIDKLKIMFDKYITFNSLNAVTKYLVDNNIKNEDNKYFHINSIRRMLANPFYCKADINFYNYAKKNNMQICNSVEEFRDNSEYGVMCYNKQDQSKKKYVAKDTSEWIVAIGRHPYCVESEKWIDVQERFLRNADKFPRQGQAMDALLSGLIRCSNCGGFFSVTADYNGGVRKNHYYRCSNKILTKGKGCNIKNIAGTQADKLFIEQFKRTYYDQEGARELFQQNKQLLDSDNIEKDIKNFQSQIEKLSKDIGKLTEKLIDAENSTASKYIVQKIEKLDEEIKELNKKITLLKSDKNDTVIKTMNFEIFNNTTKYLINNFQSLTMTEKKRIVNELVEVIYWDGETLDVHPRL